jgi:DNA-directed RNA polymerase subunit RPC12/RpoP
MEPTMECKCPSCSSALVKKNGHIHNGKQNYRCLKCSRQFVLEPSQKIIDEKTKNLIRKTLLERISLEGVCRVFDKTSYIERLNCTLRQRCSRLVRTQSRLASRQHLTKP